MFRQSTSGKKLLKLIDAFKKDGFETVKIVNKFGRTAIAAENKLVTNYDTHQGKRAYYLEGTAYQSGYLLGLLAENEIASMTGDFANKVVFSFIGSKLLEKIGLIQDAFIKIVYELGKKEFPKLPRLLREEIWGLLDGCKAANKKTEVTFERLVVLNVGVDILCSMIYSGSFPLLRLEELEPEDFKVPVMCNAFSVFGSAANGGHFFGRDFMFPTADVFHKTAAMIIYNPDTSQEESHPFVSITAPGMIGCISAMNIKGTAIGVDMSPGCNCNAKSPGVNSLLLNRLCVQNSDSAKKAVEIIKKTDRGVSWNYVIADGLNDRACVVEAGRSGNEENLLDIPVKEYKGFLPDNAFFESNKSAEEGNGVMVRWNDYKYPEAFLRYNVGLWSEYNRINNTKKAIVNNAFSHNGYINETDSEKNCPSTFYFAPQRENMDNVLVVTNHYIIPEMRIYAMHPWTCKIADNSANDVQWRYDELNRLILDEIKKSGFVSYEAARRLIDFLSPEGSHPQYYSDNPKSKDGREIRIEGCVSLFDLKRMTVESHYGYYCDGWVKITLGNYL